MLLHIIIIKLYPYSKRFSSSHTLTKSEFLLCYFGILFFFAVKTIVKSRVSELFQQKCEKSFKKILPRHTDCFNLLKHLNF